MSMKLRRPLLLSVLTFVLVALVALAGVYRLELVRQDLKRQQVRAIAADHVRDLQGNLMQALSATHTLATWVRLGRGDIAQFDALAADMQAMYPGVSALALEPGGVISKIFPLQGNAKALGLDLLRHPARQKEATLARDSGQLTLAGPFMLVQGGMGALGFHPVFLTDDKQSPKFWGFTNVVLRLPDALGPAQLDSLAQQGLDYWLWRTDPASGQRQTILGAPVELGAPVDVVLEVPNAHWVLSVAPKAGWSSPARVVEEAALALLLSLGLALLVYRVTDSSAQLGGLERDLHASQSALSVLNQELIDTLKAMPDLMFEVDLQGRYLKVHAGRQVGLVRPPEELLGKTVGDVMPALAAQQCMAAIREAEQHGSSLGLQVQLQLADGPHWFELSVSKKQSRDGAAATFLVLSRDISLRRRSEQKVERLSRLYAALSQCNQAIVRCQNKTELFGIICRDAVNFGGMRLAWIGEPDAAGKSVVPVAWFGDGADYVKGVGVSLDPSNPASHGPVGVSMREDRPCWIQDFQHDPSTQPWHARAQTYGWAAVASLPLKQKGQVVGALAVYADVPDAFDEPAQALLTEMTMDISYALDRMQDARDNEIVQKNLLESEERYRKAFRTSPDSVNINRLSDGMYLDVNEGFERLTGWTYAESVGKTSLELNIWRDPADRQQLVDLLRKDGRCSNLEAEFVTKDGGVIKGLMSASVVSFNGVPCILSITRDVSEMRRAHARIQHLAHFDQLTGLPNRALVREHFDLMRNLAKRGHEQLAVMFLDLDHFKTVNDTLGHSVGDLLLVEVSKRLTAVLRAQDSLSRMGGDEFILLLPAVDAEGAAQVASKLIAALAPPYLVEGAELVATASIGIAMYPQDGHDFETLAKNADTAMYRVKQASRNGFCFFTQEMQAQSERTLNLVGAMRHALDRGEFVLHYQPQVSLMDGRVVGAEALVRWHSADFGPLSPAEFIPIAEDSGQILEIGEWVMRTAVRQAKLWQMQGLPAMTMAVNLSAVQFRHPNLFDMVTKLLAEAELPPQYLEIELTEATAMDNPMAAIALMNRLHALGVRMSIDDFGTGYSSLSYLKKFRVAKLKIDQSFVRDINSDPDDKAIVAAVIHLASSMGLHTIAEGVETADQLAYLRLQGCDEVQGFYFSKPVPADQFEVLLRQPTVFHQ